MGSPTSWLRAHGGLGPGPGEGDESAMQAPRSALCLSGPHGSDGRRIAHDNCPRKGGPRLRGEAPPEPIRRPLEGEGALRTDAYPRQPAQPEGEVSKARRAYLDRPEQLIALLDAAGRLGHEPRRTPTATRAFAARCSRFGELAAARGHRGSISPSVEARRAASERASTGARQNLERSRASPGRGLSDPERPAVAGFSGIAGGRLELPTSRL